MPQRLDFIQRANAAYIEQQYQRYRQDPTSVPEDWALFFAGFDLAENPARAPHRAQPSGGIFALVHAYREFGHLAASLDPLGDSPQNHPLLDPAIYGMTAPDLDRPLDAQPFRGVAGV